MSHDARFTTAKADRNPATATRQSLPARLWRALQLGVTWRINLLVPVGSLMDRLERARQNP